MPKPPKISKKTLTVTATLLTTALVGLSIFTYGNFAKFRPQIPEAHKQVKGASSQNKTRLPYPEKYEIIGISEEDLGEHITYQTPISPEDIQTFYRNILASNGWQVTSTGTSGIFTTTKYKHDKKEVEVTTSLQSSDEQNAQKSTIVSLIVKG